MRDELDRRRQQTHSAFAVERVEERRKASLEGDESQAGRDGGLVREERGKDRDEAVDGD